MQPVVLVALGVLALVVTVVLLVRRARKARTEALRQASVSLGFVFEGEGHLEQLRALADLPLFRRGRDRKAWNVMSGRSGNRTLKVFDYSYTTGSGKRIETFTQTVAVYPGAGMGLPDFQLAALLFNVPVAAGPDRTGVPAATAVSSAIESMIHKMADATGGPDIDFDSSPAFSNRYVLHGPDEAAVRATFTEERRAFFEQNPGWTVEVQAGHVGLYRRGRSVKPTELASFLGQAEVVLQTIGAR